MNQLWSYFNCLKNESVISAINSICQHKKHQLCLENAEIKLLNFLKVMTFIFNIWNVHMLLVWPYELSICAPSTSFLLSQGHLGYNFDQWSLELNYSGGKILIYLENIVFMFKLWRGSFFLMTFFKLFKILYFSGFRKVLGQSRDQRFMRPRHSKLWKLVILLRWNAFLSLWTCIFGCVFVLFGSLSQRSCFRRQANDICNVKALLID